MAVTSIFGDSDKFDPVIFDTRLNYTVEIEESETIFDSAVFGDDDQFDTVRGGVVTVDDSLERLMATFRTLSESESISDSIARQLTSFRSISEATISVGVGVVSRVLSILRSITEQRTKFDSTVFGDTDQFDTTAGGAVTVDDLLARVQNLNTALSESTTVTDSLSRLQSIFRTITESTVTVSDSLSRLIQTLRSISESISITDSVARSIPSAVRHIYDLGHKLDSAIFGDSDQFDTTISTYAITDSITRSISTFRSITGVSITISDSIARILSATRTITESTISVGVGVASRVLSAFRNITGVSISLTDNVVDSDNDAKVSLALLTESVIEIVDSDNDLNADIKRDTLSPILIESDIVLNVDNNLETLSVIVIDTPVIFLNELSPAVIESVIVYVLTVVSN